MVRYSDAALLEGKFANLRAQLKSGDRQMPEPQDWKRVAGENLAEQAAQEIAKHIFSIEQQLDAQKERIEILTISPAGPMRVLGLLPGEGDLIRIDGLLMGEGRPSSMIIHASKLALSMTRVSMEQVNEDEDGLNIGFVIYDELEERQKKRYRQKTQKTKPRKAKSRSKSETKVSAGKSAAKRDKKEVKTK